MAATTRLLALFACLLGLASFVCASTVTMLNITALPGCAATCILQEMGRSECAFGNQTCLCADEAYNDFVTTCVMGNCTVKQQLVTKNQTMAACGKISVTQTDSTLKWLRVTLFILPTFFIGVRLTSKILKLSTWGWDDITIIFAYVILVGFMPANFLITAAGSGRDMWTLTPNQISRVLLVASLVLMYLRIFPDQSIRKILWATLALNIVLWVAYLPPAIFVCRPISYFWDGWMKESEGQCIDYNVSTISYSTFQLILDVILLVTPATQIWNLNMSLRKKIGVYLIFGTGIFLTAVGAYRIRALAMLTTSTNPTVNTYETAIWSNVELCTGVFVACLPSTRQLWKTTVPTLSNLTNMGSKSAASKSSNPGTNSRGTAGYAKKQPAERKSWVLRMVDDTNKPVPLRELRSVSTVSLVESPDRPDRSMRFNEV